MAFKLHSKIIGNNPSPNPKPLGAGSAPPNESPGSASDQGFKPACVRVRIMFEVITAQATESLTFERIK